MTQDEFEKFRQQTDDQIKSGQFAQAQKALNSLKVSEVPHSKFQELGNLYRRANLWKLTLTALKPKVRPKVSSAQPQASAGVKIEYALSLQRAGAYRESSVLLDEPDVRALPQGWLAKAFSEIYHWNYADAAPLLERFISSQSGQPYENLTARVNLLACHSQTNNPRFMEELKDLRKDLKASDNRLLLAGVLEMEAYYLITNRQWADAEHTLAEAEALLRGESSNQMLFVDKWRVVAKALKSNSTAPLDAFRPVALQTRHWETLRDLDYIRAILEPESPLTEWAYYGTPYPSFRAKMEKLRDFSEQAVVSRSTQPKHTVDPWFVGGQDGSQVHLLLILLLKDFYRPARVGHIFSELFWDEFLDMDSVQDRVHQLIRRLRTWIEKNKLPFKILEIESSYALRIDESAGLTCRKQVPPLQKLPFLFGRFYANPPGTLTAREWAEQLQVTVVKARNLLSEAHTLGLVAKQGSGPKTNYKIS